MKESGLAIPIALYRPQIGPLARNGKKSGSNRKKGKKWFKNSHFSRPFPVGPKSIFRPFFSPFRAGGPIWGLYRAIGIASLVSSSRFFPSDCCIWGQRGQTAPNAMIARIDSLHDLQMLLSLREETQRKLQMLVSPRKNGLDFLFKEVGVSKEMLLRVRQGGGRGGRKTSRRTRKRVFDPPPLIWYAFQPPSGVIPLLFLYKNPRLSRPEALLDGVQKFSGGCILWYVFLPPYVLQAPRILAQTEGGLSE